MSIKKPARAKKSSFKGLWIVLGVILVVVVAAGYFVNQYLNTAPGVIDQPGTSPGQPDDKTNDNDDMQYVPITGSTVGRKEGVYTFLLVGTMDNYNTDTIMLASMDTVNHKVHAISIPRDTMVDVKASNKKINGRYGAGGMEELCKAVQSLTGIYPDYYALVQVENFIKLVDLVDGVEFDVPYDMYHKDDDPKYTINLKKGLQTLDGSKALQMVRYRGTSQNDFGRIELQKQLLVAIAKKAISEFDITKITSMGPVVLESLKTNIGLKDLLWFYRQLSNFDLDADVEFHTMPVATMDYYKGRAYVFGDRDEFVALLNETVNPFTKELTANDVTIIQKPPA